MPVKPQDVKREARRYSLSYDFDGLATFKPPFQPTPVLGMAQAMAVARVEIVGHRGAALGRHHAAVLKRPPLLLALEEAARERAHHESVALGDHRMRIH